MAQRLSQYDNHNSAYSQRRNFWESEPHHFFGGVYRFVCDAKQIDSADAVESFIVINTQLITRDFLKTFTPFVFCYIPKCNNLFITGPPTTTAGANLTELLACHNYNLIKFLFCVCYHCMVNKDFHKSPRYFLHCGR